MMDISARFQKRQDVRRNIAPFDDQKLLDEISLLICALDECQTEYTRRVNLNSMRYENAPN